MQLRQRAADAGFDVRGLAETRDGVPGVRFGVGARNQVIGLFGGADPASAAEQSQPPAPPEATAVIAPPALDAKRTDGDTVFDERAHDLLDFIALNGGLVDTIPTAAWRADAGSVAESDPAFRTVTATPRSLAFYFKVSRELLADAFNLNSALANVIAQAMAKEMDRAGLLGSGSPPEPRGIANVSGIQSVGNGTAGTSLATIKYSNLMSAVQAILQANGPMPNAAIMAPRTLVGLGNLADSTGQPLQRPDLLRDMRMIATSQIPVNQTVGASTDCSSMFVGSFARTRFVLREAVSIQKLNELFAGTPSMFRDS